jgi:hypothetical protein
MCAFEVVGASRDWAALAFSKLPEKMCAFAEEVFSFCPDSVGQGTGSTWDFRGSNEFLVIDCLAAKSFIAR